MSERPPGRIDDPFRLLLDGITDCSLFFLDPEGRVTNWNAGAERMLGYREEEIVGQPVSRLFTPEDIEMGEPAKELLLAAAGRLSQDRWLIRKDGSHLWARCVTTAVRGEAGDSRGFVRFLQDRTEQRLTEENMLTSERRFRALMENAWDGFTLVAADGTMLETTSSTFRGLGYTEEEYVGRNGFDLLHPDDKTTVEELMGRVLARQGERVTAQYRLRHKDGSWRWVEAVGTNLLDDPSVKAVVVNHRDITAQMDADRRKDEWLAMLAHELRGPLGPVRNAVEVLIRKGPSDPELDRARSVIVRQTEHLARIVDGLLEVTRLLQGEIRIAKERLDLARLVRATGEDHRLVLERAGLTLDLTVPQTPVWVLGDATRLRQILGNLLDNAVKFKAGGDRVELILRSDPGQAVLIVRDAGLGIEPHLLPILFDVFAQGDRSLHRTTGGLGLGLSLVKGLVQLHGGEVRAASRGPGSGAEFTVVLPLEKEPAALTAIPSRSWHASRRLRILIVEDCRDAADSLQLLLNLQGHEVQVAYTGPDGVRAAAAWAPEVIISDIGLPGLDGYGVASEVRRNPATANARLIALTGYGGEEERRRALESGFDFHFTKPADPTRLQQLLAKLGA
jgi:PAS domain S-box-containing protein